MYLLERWTGRPLGRAGVWLGRLSVIVALFSCAHVSKTQPTPKGNVDFEMGFGGPIANVPGIGTIPVPLDSVGVSVGVARNLDVSVHTHLTTLALFGLLGLDVGSTWQPLQQDGARPALTLTGRLYGFTNFRDGFRPYLETEGNVSWRYARYFGSYATLNGMFQLAAPPVLMVGVGQEFYIGRVGLTVEGRWYQPGANARFAVVDWARVGEQGALGVLLGVRVRFGGQR